MVTIISKDLGDAKVKRGGEFKKTFEDLNEDYIKREFGIED